MVTDKLLTVQQVAEKLQMHTETVYRYIRAGVLKAVRPGKTYRIKESDLEVFINGTGNREEK